MIQHSRNINMYPGVRAPERIHLSQYDSDFTLVFSLYSSAGSFSVESGTTAMVRGTKGDGNGYSASASLSGTTVTVQGNNQMTAVAGSNTYELVLTRSGKVLSTANFILDVEPAAMDANTIQSDTVLMELQAIIDSASVSTAAADRAEEAAEEAEGHANGTVRFDVDQSLTDAQKTQAKSNIGLLIDNTLTQAGQAADAKKTGDEINTLIDLKYVPGYEEGAVTDKDGNILMLGGSGFQQLEKYVPDFSGGAILDKNGNILLIGESQENVLSGKYVSVIGDSISSYRGYIPDGYRVAYPTEDVDNVNKMWWKRLIDMSGMQLCVNASWSGSRICGNLLEDQTAYLACSTQRISDLTNPITGKKPDVIIIFIGTNDWSANEELGDFTSTSEPPTDGDITEIATGYALMLYKIRQFYPKATVFCICPLCRTISYDSDYPILNRSGNSIHQISLVIERIAPIFGAIPINMEKMGMHQWNIGDFLRGDELHPDAAGMEMIARRVFKVVNEYFSGL